MRIDERRFGEGEGTNAMEIGLAPIPHYQALEAKTAPI